MLTSKNVKLHYKSTCNLLKQERRWWRQKGRRERSEDRSKREDSGGRKERSEHKSSPNCRAGPASRKRKAGAERQTQGKDGYSHSKAHFHTPTTVTQVSLGKAEKALQITHAVKRHTGRGERAKHPNMHLQTLQFTYMYLQSITGEGTGEEWGTSEHSLAAVKDKGGEEWGVGSTWPLEKAEEALQSTLTCTCGPEEGGNRRQTVGQPNS